MNILFVDQFSEPGGAQFCLLDLIPEVIRRGWNARLMAPGEGELLAWFHKFGVPTHSLPLKRLANGRKTPLDFLRFTANAPHVAAEIRRVAEKHRIALVYVNGPRVLPAAIGVGCPVIFHAHNRVTSLSGRKLIAWALDRTNAGLIAASGFVAQSYARPCQPVRVVYSGVSDMGFSVRSRPNRPARVGIVGRISPEKGHMDFVRAAMLVRDARFYVYGAPLFSDATYERAVHRTAEGSPVEFPGWVEDIPAALRDLDVLAVPSDPNEAATRVIMEAFSAGVPVVAYPSGGIPEIVENGRTGVLTESSDHYSLAHNIGDLLQDSSRMERFSLAGRAEWERRFTVRSFRANVCDFVESYLKPSAQVAIQKAG